MRELLKLQDHQQQDHQQQDHEQQGEPSVVVAPTISTTSERTPPKLIVVKKLNEPGARRKMLVRPYDAATVATERRVKALLDEQKKDPAWWDKYNDNVRKNQERLADHNCQIDERDERERQRAYEKLQRMPGGPLYKEAKSVKIIETVLETEEGFPQPDPSPLPSSSGSFLILPYSSSTVGGMRVED